MHLSKAITQGLEFEALNYQLTTGLEYLWGPFSIISQYMWCSGMLESPDLLADPSQYIGGTFKWQFYQWLLCLPAIVQNLDPTQNTVESPLRWSCSFGFEPLGLARRRPIVHANSVFLSNLSSGALPAAGTRREWRPATCSVLNDRGETA